MVQNDECRTIEEEELGRMPPEVFELLADARVAICRAVELAETAVPGPQAAERIQWLVAIITGDIVDQKRTEWVTGAMKDGTPLALETEN